MTFEKQKRTEPIRNNHNNNLSTVEKYNLTFVNSEVNRLMIDLGLVIQKYEKMTLDYSNFWKIIKTINNLNKLFWIIKDLSQGGELPDDFNDKQIGFYIGLIKGELHFLLLETVEYLESQNNGKYLEIDFLKDEIKRQEFFRVAEKSSEFFLVNCISNLPLNKLKETIKNAVEGINNLYQTDLGIDFDLRNKITVDLNKLIK